LKFLKDVKIGFLAYRDLKDVNRFEKFGFTDDIPKLEKFIGDLKADGGDDDCEDIIGALQLAYKDFEFSIDGYNMMFLICDAPCHGSQYHDGCGDSFPDQEDHILEKTV
jgi:hypothetical protein